MFGWAIRRNKQDSTQSQTAVLADAVDEKRFVELVQQWCDEQVVHAEQRFFRFGVSGTLVSAVADAEHGSVRVTNTDGRTLVLAAPADTADEIAAMLYGGPARYHVGSSTSAGSVGVIWVWSRNRSRSRCFLVTAVVEAGQWASAS